MKTKTLLSILLITFSFFLKAQTQDVNRYDANGKKHGVWIVWLDKDWKLAKDSMSAEYYRYNYFDHGASVYAMGPWGGKGNKLETTAPGTVKKGNAKLLNGEYKWYNSKGELISSHILRTGWYVSFKEYYSSGQVQTFFDYTKKYENQEHTYYFCGYDKNGKLKWESWEREQNGKRAGGKGVDN
jgi:hypothetical protein